MQNTNLEFMKEIPLRYDNASTLEEATRIYNEIAAYNQMWYKKQLVFMGSKVQKIKQQKFILLEDIILGLAIAYGLEVEQLKSRSRKSPIMKPRHCIVYTLVHKYKFDKKSVGKVIGGRDHSTAINSIKVVEQWLETKRSYEEELSLLKIIYPEKFE